MLRPSNSILPARGASSPKSSSGSCSCRRHCRRSSVTISPRRTSSATRRAEAYDVVVGGDHALKHEHVRSPRNGRDRPRSRPGRPGSRRRAVGELAAIIENGDLVAHIHHHVHMVLDQDDGGAAIARMRPMSSITCADSVSLRPAAGSSSKRSSASRRWRGRSPTGGDVHKRAMRPAHGQCRPGRRTAAPASIAPAMRALPDRRRGVRSTASRSPQRVSACSPMATFSSAVISRKSLRFWKVRRIPRRARPRGRTPCDVVARQNAASRC